jgi:hypothetical protein
VKQPFHYPLGDIAPHLSFWRSRATLAQYRPARTPNLSHRASMSEKNQNRAADQMTDIDRRESPRFPIQGVAVFRRADDAGGGRRVDLHDISTTGISFTTDKQVKLGQNGILEIPSEADSQEPQRLEVVILWAVLNDATRRCRVGCKWLQPLTQSDLSRFV